MPIIPINLSLAVGRNILPMALSSQFGESSGFGQELIMIHFSLASGQICLHLAFGVGLWVSFYNILNKTNVPQPALECKPMPSI